MSIIDELIIKINALMLISLETFMIVILARCIQPSIVRNNLYILSTCQTRKRFLYLTITLKTRGKCLYKLCLNINVTKVEPNLRIAI